VKVKTAYKILINDELAQNLAQKQGRTVKAVRGEARGTIRTFEKRNRRKNKRENINSIMGESEL